MPVSRLLIGEKVKRVCPVRVEPGGLAAIGLLRFTLVKGRATHGRDPFDAMSRIGHCTGNDEIIGLAAEHKFVAAGREGNASSSGRNLIISALSRTGDTRKS